MSWIAYYTCQLPEIIQNALLQCQLRMLAMRQCNAPADMPRNPIEKPGWKLTFQDDFDSGALDTSKWTDMPYYGHRYNTGEFASGGTPKQIFLASNIVFTASTVKLIVDNQPTGGLYDPLYHSGNDPFTIPYSAAWIGWEHSIEQRHGYFEIRCKIPSAPYMWPAFWLCCRGPYPWPPEIDVFEFPTANPTDHFISTHHWGTEQNHQLQGYNHTVCRPTETFHIYSCEWTENEIRWYYDNVLIRVATDGLSEFTYPMHVIVNSAVNGGSFAQLVNSTYPNYLEVDYVRCYSR